MAVGKYLSWLLCFYIRTETYTLWGAVCVKTATIPFYDISHGDNFFIWATIFCCVKTMFQGGRFRFMATISFHGRQFFSYPGDDFFVSKLSFRVTIPFYGLHGDIFIRATIFFVSKLICFRVTIPFYGDFPSRRQFFLSRRRFFFLSKWERRFSFTTMIKISRRLILSMNNYCDKCNIIAIIHTYNIIHVASSLSTKPWKNF